MEQEFETQVPDIDIDEIVSKLRKLGAKEEPEALQKRWVFNINKRGHSEWIRLRQSGSKTTICYKNKAGTGVSETSEIEIEVDDFDKAAALLSKLGFYFDKYFQESKKHVFILDGISFEICTFPLIPPVLEIEAKSEKEVHKGLKLLDLTGKDVGHIGWEEIYKRYGLNLHSFKELKFEA